MDDADIRSSVGKGREIISFPAALGRKQRKYGKYDRLIK